MSEKKSEYLSYLPKKLLDTSNHQNLKKKTQQKQKKKTKKKKKKKKKQSNTGDKGKDKFKGRRESKDLTFLTKKPRIILAKKKKKKKKKKKEKRKYGRTGDTGKDKFKGHTLILSLDLV